MDGSTIISGPSYVESDKMGSDKGMIAGDIVKMTPVGALYAAIVLTPEGERTVYLRLSEGQVEENTTKINYLSPVIVPL